MAGSMQLEVLATFEVSAKELPTAPFGVEVLRNSNGSSTTRIEVDCSGGLSSCRVGVDGWKRPTFGPLLPMVTKQEGDSFMVRLHAIVDGSIVEAIFNNRTAMVVYARPEAETDTGVMLFGTDAEKVKGTLTTYELNSISAALPKSEIVV